MHPDLSSHLHTPECNILINKLKECHTTKKFGRFIGLCNDIDHELNKCLKAERKSNQAANRQKAAERQERMHKAMNENKAA